VNVLDHVGIDCLRGDAKMLDMFLGKPIWDATRTH
jgi:hypothetical protein